MKAPRFTKLVSSLPSTVPFVGPETQERARGQKFAARLGANENVFGPSPKVIAAMQAAVPDVWMYGDPENHDLKLALAAFHGVQPENVVVGAGIDGLLGSLARMLVSDGTPVVTSLGAYPTSIFMWLVMVGHCTRYLTMVILRTQLDCWKRRVKLTPRLCISRTLITRWERGTMQVSCRI